MKVIDVRPIVDRDGDTWVEEQGSWYLTADNNSGPHDLDEVEDCYGPVHRSEPTLVRLHGNGVVVEGSTLQVALAQSADLPGFRTITVVLR